MYGRFLTVVESLKKVANEMHGYLSHISIWHVPFRLLHTNTLLQNDVKYLATRSEVKVVLS